MNLGALRSRTQLKLNDFAGREIEPSYIDTLINEGMRVMAFETLLLEDDDTSLTYSSSDDGFALPSDFIKVKTLCWTTANSSIIEIPAKGLKEIRDMRNRYINYASDTIDTLTPMGYAIQNGYIILDSTTETSPVLYYYKYDTALSADANSPSFDSEYHRYLVDYVINDIAGDVNAWSRWQKGLSDMRSSKNQVDSIRSRYIGL